VRGGIIQFLSEFHELFVAQFLSQGVHSHGADEPSIVDLLSILCDHDPSISIHSIYGALFTQEQLLLGECIGDGYPNAPSTSHCGEAEGRIGSPVAGRLLEDRILHDGFEVGGGDTLAEP